MSFKISTACSHLNTALIRGSRAAKKGLRKEGCGSTDANAAGSCGAPDVDGAARHGHAARVGTERLQVFTLTT